MDENQRKNGILKGKTKGQQRKSRIEEEKDIKDTLLGDKE